MLFLLEKLRGFSFWMIDFLKGAKIKRHYNEIKFILEQYGTEESKLKRDKYLKDLLKHAVNTTPFYENYKGFNSIADFPIINKLVLIDNYEKLQSNEFRNKVNHKMSTSGSSGTPFTILQDENKKLRNTADTIYFAKQAGFNIGDRLYYFRKWSKKHQKNPIETFRTNIEMVNVTDYTDEYLSNFLSTFSKDSSNKAMLGYSSAFRDLCKYMERKNLKPIKTNITSIIAMSEALSDYTRALMEKYFNKPVVSRYSNMENGILAQQFVGHGPQFHVKWASYYI